MTPHRLTTFLCFAAAVACGAEDVPPEGELCSHGSEPARLALEGVQGDLSVTEIRSSSGTATVTVDSDGLTFPFVDAGHPAGVQLFAKALPLPTGEYSYALTYRPFYLAPEASLELASSRGTVLKAWSLVSGQLPGGPPIGLQYSEASCENEPGSCYRSRPLLLTASASGVSITLDANASGTLGPWKVVNGSSFVLVGESSCTDINPRRDGYFVRTE